LWSKKESELQVHFRPSNWNHTKKLSINLGKTMREGNERGYILRHMGKVVANLGGAQLHQTSCWQSGRTVRIVTVFANEGRMEHMAASATAVMPAWHSDTSWNLTYFSIFPLLLKHIHLKLAKLWACTKRKGYYRSMFLQIWGSSRPRCQQTAF
jgi:hypothetical protein